MKQFIFAIIILVLTACTEYTIGYDKDELLSLSTDKIEMEYDGGQASVEIESICSWDLTICSSCDWVHSSVNHGNGGKNSVTITIDKNKTITPRSATITISNEQCNISYQIAIEQKAGTPNIEVSPEELVFTYESGAKGLKIISNIDYTITSSQEWCTIDATKGGSGEKELQVSVTKNSTIEPRSATVKIENSEYKIVKEVVVTQSSSAPAINVGETEIFVTVDGISKEVKVSSNIPWNASCNADWVTLTPTIAEIGETLLSITIANNTKVEPRSAIVRIYNEEHGVIKEIVISQAAFVTQFEVDKTSISATVDGGSFNATITSNISWKASCEADWVTLSPTDGASGTTTLKIAIAKNTITAARSATIKIVNQEHGLTKEIEVSQEAFTTQFEVNKTSVSASVDGGSYSATVTSNISWRASCDANWVTLSPTDGASGTTTLKIAIAKNSTTELRSAIVRISNEEYNLFAEIRVIQDATFYKESVSSLNINMIYVEGGTFNMGSDHVFADSNEKPIHDVTLDSFYIAECEITQAQWQAVMGNNPSYCLDDNRPVERVSWYDAQEFCEKLSQLTGKTYVLPTEAQWEFAARGGNKSKNYEYSGSNSIDRVAWYWYDYDNTDPQTLPVKQLSPNELGIYDMSGNVYEWCSDWYSSSYYSSSPTNNPTGPSSGSYRVLRGGGCTSNPGDCYVWSRSWYNPGVLYKFVGFRIVCIP